MPSSKAVEMMGPDVGGLGATTAMKRTSSPEEVAHVIVFLASDRSGTSPARRSRSTAAAERSSGERHRSDRVA